MDYKWSKSEYPKGNGLKVFTTFACGGGSTMGYKLAGFDVIGANDIDPEMAKVYKHNHNPKIYIQAPIKDLITMDLPEELFGLDILDGSPPCSTFSTAGKRDENWGKLKKFREGQSEQVLDDLFFDFIAVAERLRPKVIIAENVKGMLVGNAKGYLVMVKKRLEAIGYRVQLFLLNGATMGVPQKRERVFFVCSRNDLNYPKITLSFNEKPIPLREVFKRTEKHKGKPLTPAYRKWYDKMQNLSGSFGQVHPKGSFFNTKKASSESVLYTITSASVGKICHPYEPYELSNQVYSLCGTFPTDYDYMNVDPKYLIGMSVPPLMIYGIAKEVEKQWFLR
jgi:DNA (cytosine-5)-methyltransferase 1